MIPIGDENPVRTKPYIVYLLVAVNVLVYLVDRAGAQGPIGALWNWSMIPRSVVTNEPSVFSFPVQQGPFIVRQPVMHVGLNPQWLTILSSMFMHGGLLHIGSNLLYLWIFGNNIEDALGHAKFLVFYLACGVFAALAQIASDPMSAVPVVGASGAIAGVLGAYLFLYPANRIRTLVLLGFFWTHVDIPAMLVLGVWFLTQLMNVGGSGGLHGGVAYWAHIGGFVSGFVIVAILGGRRLARPGRRYTRSYDRRPYPWRPWE